MKPVTISFYGHFGAGNLGNECTLRATIEQTLRCWPGAQVLCFCACPQEVRTHHGIEAFPSKAIERTGSYQRRGGLARILRIAVCRMPLELLHWVKSLRTVSRTDILIVAGTGIVADYTTGPMGWPYDIFKFSTLAALCRVKLVFLSVGVGPIHHPLSRWFLKRSLALASHRSYRDVTSKQYLEKIGFNTNRDLVFPDVVFGLSPSHLRSVVGTGQRRIIGLGLKDYKDYRAADGPGPKVFREYIDTMATFVSWLQDHGYGVRLLIGDTQYDIPVIEQFIDTLKHRNIPTCAPLLMAQPARTVNELLSQVSETEAVISPRYHNLIMALIQNKPVVALSDHAKLESLVTDFGLGQFHLPLRNIRLDSLISRFEELEKNTERLRSYIGEKLENYRHALDVQCETLLGETRVGAQTMQPNGNGSAGALADRLRAGQSV